MSPEEFISRWRGRELKERQFYQSHFNELCRVLDVPDPISFARDADYCFEKAVPHTDGAAGFADVWKRDSFVWEYKGETKNLTTALVQADRYARALANPPLLIVSDAQEIRVRTNFTNEVSVTRTYRLHDLATEASRRELRDCWIAPDRLRPTVTREAVTAKAAGAVGDVAARLRARKDAPDPRRIAHVMNRFVFCLFAEDIGVLPDQLFSEILEDCLNDPPRFALATRGLFRAMKDRDGLFGSTRVPWVNGGLFDDDDVLDLDGLSIRDLFEASKLDWSAIEPSIFGTLFERSLNPSKRAQLGAHYTSRADILLIVEPVLMTPLRRRWEGVQAEVEGLLRGASTRRATALRTVRAKIQSVADELAAVRVLDPACGSGNFLYVALRQLLDMEKEVLAFASEKTGDPLAFPRVSPAQLFGIEKDEYAHELAQTTVWIGYIQWLRENGFGYPAEPILRKLDNIHRMDAVLHIDPLTGAASEPAWPPAEVIVGNPPFLGGSQIRRNIGNDYTNKLFALYSNRIPNTSDLVCY
jgi:hypothetical protein